MCSRDAAIVAEVLAWACDPKPDEHQIEAKNHVYGIIMKHLSPEKNNGRSLPIDMA